MMNLREYFDRQQEKSASIATSQPEPEALGDMSTTVSASSYIVVSTSGLLFCYCYKHFY